MLRVNSPSTRQTCRYVCQSCRRHLWKGWDYSVRQSRSFTAKSADVYPHETTLKALTRSAILTKLLERPQLRRSQHVSRVRSQPHNDPHCKPISTSSALTSPRSRKSTPEIGDSAPNSDRISKAWKKIPSVPKISKISRAAKLSDPVQADSSSIDQQTQEETDSSANGSDIQKSDSKQEPDLEIYAGHTQEGGNVKDLKVSARDDSETEEVDDIAIDPPGVSLAEALKKPRKKNDSSEKLKAVDSKSADDNVREDEEDSASFERIVPEDVPVIALEVAQPKVPALQHGLDRVLFNPGVYHVRDPRSNVYNFPLHVAKVTPADEFNFDALGSFTIPSEDPILQNLASTHATRYYGSTSSTTGILSHLHYLISHWRRLNLSDYTKGFTQDGDNFTLSFKAPVSVFVKRSSKRRESTYAITSDKSGLDDTGSSILSLAGRSLEKLFTSTQADYEQLKLAKASADATVPKAPVESFHYTKFGDILIRSQLDAHDARLPGTGMFDLKTRAVAPIRMDIHERMPAKTNYQITERFGNIESYERERFDMMRATMLKYALQVRLGRMDGIFVAYHNLDTIFGFQYIALPELDSMLHGTPLTKLGDQELSYSMKMLSSVLDKVRESIPNQHFRLVVETREKKLPFTYVFAEPISDEEYNTAVAAAKDRQRDAEKALRSKLVVEAKQEAVGEGTGSPLSDTDISEAELQRWQDFKDAVKDEISQDAISVEKSKSSESSAYENVEERTGAVISEAEEPSPDTNDIDSIVILDHEAWLFKRMVHQAVQDCFDLKVVAEKAKTDQKLKMCYLRAGYILHDIELCKQNSVELEVKIKSLSGEECTAEKDRLSQVLRRGRAEVDTRAAQLLRLRIEWETEMASKHASTETDETDAYRAKSPASEALDVFYRTDARLTLSAVRFRRLFGLYKDRAIHHGIKPATILELETFSNDQKALQAYIQECEQFLNELEQAVKNCEEDAHPALCAMMTHFQQQLNATHKLQETLDDLHAQFIESSSKRQKQQSDSSSGTPRSIQEKEIAEEKKEAKGNKEAEERKGSGEDKKAEETILDPKTPTTTASETTKAPTPKAPTPKAPTPKAPTPKSSQPKPDRPLFAYVLTCRNIVNGKYVDRPDALEENDLWTIEYSIEQITDKGLARDRYETCKRRRREVFNRDKDEKSISGFYRSRLMSELARFSERGKELKERQGVVDREKGVVLFEQGGG